VPRVRSAQTKSQTRLRARLCPLPDSPCREQFVGKLNPSSFYWPESTTRTRARISRNQQPHTMFVFWCYFPLLTNHRLSLAERDCQYGSSTRSRCSFRFLITHLLTIVMNRMCLCTYYLRKKTIYISGVKSRTIFRWAPQNAEREALLGICV
jgi:hypothetical protein